VAKFALGPTVLAGRKEVVERKGVFCALYSDRGSHFWLTPKAGEAVDPHRLTQVGRAMRELGVRMIPAYSPQARGRSERSFGTWQGRLPQELRLHGIRTVEAANAFLREYYIGEFNRRFQVASAQPGSAFMPYRGKDLQRIFSLQFERTVNRDNTVSFQNLTLQIEPVRWRGTLAGCTVTIESVTEEMDGSDRVSGPETITSGPWVGMAEPSTRAKWRALRSARVSTLKKCLTGTTLSEMGIFRQLSA